MATASTKSERRRQAAFDDPIDLTSPDCELVAIKQFTCTYVPNIRIDCKPLQRLFMICAGRSLEVTPQATVDATGAVTLPSQFETRTGKLWQDLPGRS